MRVNFQDTLDKQNIQWLQVLNLLYATERTLDFFQNKEWMEDSGENFSEDYNTPNIALSLSVNSYLNVL